jgi:hypothetical protein
MEMSAFLPVAANDDRRCRRQQRLPQTYFTSRKLQGWPAWRRLEWSTFLRSSGVRWRGKLLFVCGLLKSFSRTVKTVMKIRFWVVRVVSAYEGALLGSETVQLPYPGMHLLDKLLPLALVLQRDSQPISSRAAIFTRPYIVAGNALDSEASNLTVPGDSRTR